MSSFMFYPKIEKEITNFFFYFIVRGGSMISGKGVHIYLDLGVGGVRFGDFISFYLNIPWKWNNLVSLRPNYFIFIGYFKTGGREGVRVSPLNPLHYW